MNLAQPLKAGIEADPNVRRRVSDAIKTILSKFYSIAARRTLTYVNPVPANDELAELRYQASIRPSWQESFSSMFPSPRQQWVDALLVAEAKLMKTQRMRSRGVVNFFH